MYHAIDIFNEFYNNLRLEDRDGYIWLAPEEKVYGKSFCDIHGDEGPPPSTRELFSGENLERLIEAHRRHRQG